MRHRIALLIVLLAIIGVLAISTVVLAETISWGELKCRYHPECLKTIDTEDKNSG